MLRAVQVVVDEGLAKPVLIGRPEVIAARIEKFGLRIARRQGLRARQHQQRSALQRVLAALLPADGAQGHLAGGREGGGAAQAVADRHAAAADGRAATRWCAAPSASTTAHLRHVADVIGRRPDAPVFAAMNGLLLPNRTLFICDTYVNRNPSAEQLAEIARLAADAVRRFGLVAQGRAAVALQFRQRRLEVGAQDARGAAPARRARAGAGSRRRDARRCGAVGGDPHAASIPTRR